MASFLNANFDSEDEEEDDDYVVTEAEQKEVLKEQGVKLPPKAKRGSKRGRGIPAPRTETAEEGAEEGEGDDDDEEEPEQPRLVLPKPGQAAAKRAKIEAVWLALNSKDTGGANACRPPSSSINLAALCGRSKEDAAPALELTWQRQLGLMAPQLQRNVYVKPSETPGAANGSAANEANGTSAGAGPEAGDVAGTSTSAQPEGAATASGEAADMADAGAGKGQPAGSGRQISESAKAAAAAALAAAKEAASLGSSRSYNKVSVTETRRFAGQDIQVTVQVDKDSKEAAKKEKAAPAASGLDRFLAELEKKKKVNILDKSKMDWNQLKSADTNMEEELEAHKRSNKKYLDKVEFLKKAELREYEIERDKRLQGDVRLRNRL